MSMIGKFCHVVTGESYATGEIVEQVAPEAWLVRYDNASSAPDAAPTVRPLEMVHVSQMCEPDGGDVKWYLFDTRADLQSWLDWVKEPEVDKVCLIQDHAKKGK